MNEGNFFRNMWLFSIAMSLFTLTYKIGEVSNKVISGEITIHVVSNNSDTIQSK